MPWAGAIVLLALAYVAALLTWSIEDPSFNHATDNPATNLMGFAGAAVADIAMQMFGLASYWLALPLAMSGLALVRSRRLPIGRWRMVACIAGTIAAAGACAAFGKPASWPLPIGVGGFVGEALMAPPLALLEPYLGALARGVAVFVYGAGAIAGLAWGSGLLGGAQADSRAQERDDGHARARAGNLAESEEEDDRGGFGTVGLGFLMHGFMVLGGWISRLRYGRKPRVLSVRTLFEDEQAEAARARESRGNPDFSGRPPQAGPVHLRPRPLHGTGGRSPRRGP